MIAAEEVYIYNRATSCLPSLAQHVVQHVMAHFGYKHRLLQMLIAYEAELTFQAQLVLHVLNSTMCYTQYDTRCT